MNFQAHGMRHFSFRAIRRIRLILLTLSVLVMSYSSSDAWVYPEHRAITLRAIKQLDIQKMAALERIWASARTGHESRLSAAPADSSDPDTPTTIDFAAWPAIAGDHSCSAENMLHTILATQWILDVAAVTARLNEELSTAGLLQYRRTNALRDADLMLQRVDPEYATRAGANNVHFLLSRPYAETTLQAYLETCLGNGCELNAIGTYAWYHVSALQKISVLSEGTLSEPEKDSLALAALADEAYALHFLQDVFAAGHVAGTRGDPSLRKGTHDYYNEYGLEVHTWDGTVLVLKGDAWMRPEDSQRAAHAVRASLEQLLEAAEGSGYLAHSLAGGFSRPVADTLNTCALESMPDRDFDDEAVQRLGPIIRTTPVPGLAEGAGELPRFRAEIGPFIGFVPAVRGLILNGGFGKDQKASGATGGLEVAVRLGLGLDGVMNESGDGLVFLDAGFRLDGASSTSVYETDAVRQFGQMFAAVPSRAAITGRLRIPFWLVPLDLLIAAPILLPASPKTFEGMAVMAANGGLIPWQAGIATSFGRFQFVLGREVGVAFYGYLKGEDRMLLPVGAPEDENAVLADLRSVQLEFPVVEYMPFRTFSSNQSSSLVIQLFGGVDIPTSVSNILPADYPEPDLGSIWQIGLRAAFRWRHYW